MNWRAHTLSFDQRQLIDEELAKIVDDLLNMGCISNVNDRNKEHFARTLYWHLESIKVTGRRAISVGL